MSNKKFSYDKLKEIIFKNRQQLGLSQQELADKTGINRTMISKMERGDYIPSILQLEKLASILNFDVTSLFIASGNQPSAPKLSKHKIAVAGTGYVSLSIAV